MPGRRLPRPCLRPARRHRHRRLPHAGTHPCWPRKTLRTPVVPGSRFLNAVAPRSTYPAAGLDYAPRGPRLPARPGQASTDVFAAEKAHCLLCSRLPDSCRALASGRQVQGRRDADHAVTPQALWTRWPRRRPTTRTRARRRRSGLASSFWLPGIFLVTGQPLAVADVSGLARLPGFSVGVLPVLSTPSGALAGASQVTGACQLCVEGVWELNDWTLRSSTAGPRMNAS